MAEMNKFDTLLDNLAKSVANTRELALKTSQVALQHFHDNGDVVYLQRMFDFMRGKENKNFLRSAAFAKWAMKYSPLAYDVKTHKFSKDKSEDAKVWNLAAALAKPFWDDVPTKENIEFTVDNIVEAMVRAVSKFKGEKYNPHDVEATRKLRDAEALVEQFKSSINAAKVAQVQEQPQTEPERIPA